MGTDSGGKLTGFFALFFFGGEWGIGWFVSGFTFFSFLLVVGVVFWLCVAGGVCMGFLLLVFWLFWLGCLVGVFCGFVVVVVVVFYCHQPFKDCFFHKITT